MFLNICFLKKLFFITMLTSLSLYVANATDINEQNKIEIKASDKLEWHQLENKIVALGDAEVKSSLFSINANKIEGFYEGLIGKGKLQKLIASEKATFKTSQITINSNFMNYNLANENLLVEGDNISMISNLGTVYSQKRLFYKKNEKKIILDGNVLIILKNPETKINANKLTIKIDENENIIYVKAIDNVNVIIDNLQQNISSNEAEFFNLEQKINFEGNVIIKQNESFLKGNSAVIDIEKGLSSITSNEQNSVTGVFY